MRAERKPRYWPVVFIAVLGVGAFWLINLFIFKHFDGLAELKAVWPAAIQIPGLGGMAATLAVGGTPMWKRIVGGAACGCLMAVFQTALFVLLGYHGAMTVGDILINAVWKVFAYTIFSTLGVILTELSLPGVKPGVDSVGE